MRSQLKEWTSKFSWIWSQTWMGLDKKRKERKKLDVGGLF